MRLRNLLAATAVGALALGGAAAPTYSVTAPPSQAGGGEVVGWGDTQDPNEGPDAIDTPADINRPVVSLGTNGRASGAVTADGKLVVWGKSTFDDVNMAPVGVTDAAAVTFAIQHAAVLHKDGHITAWGKGDALDDVPTDLRATAIALQSDVGYAVKPDGTLATWGGTLAYPVPATGMTDLVDVSASLTHAIALRSDGTIAIWGAPLPGLNEHPDFGSKKVAKIQAGFLYSLVVFEDGSMQTWGVGDPADKPTFDGLTSAGKVISLATNSNSAASAAVTADGAVHIWGGAPSSISTIPASLTGRPVSGIAMGGAHAAVIVDRVASSTTLAVSPATGPVGGARTATATVTQPGSGSGGTITFKVGTDTKTVPVTGGKAVWALPTRAPGSRTVTAVYNGSVSSFASTATPVTIQVTKAAGKVSARAKANHKAKKVTLTVTAASATRISPAGQVTITIKGKTKKTVRVTVNANGTGSVTVKKLKKGKYTATVTYAGNGNVTGARTAVKFKL